MLFVVFLWAAAVIIIRIIIRIIVVMGTSRMMGRTILVINAVVLSNNVIRCGGR